MKKLALMLAVNFIFLTPMSIFSQSVSCGDLISTVKYDASRIGSVSSFQLIESSWLVEVTAYKYENVIFVIARIKTDNFGISSKEYIFCGVPRSNWDKFSDNLANLYDNSTYGERFHDYIYDYKCNCY